jgi:hypothetical protein
MVNTRRVAILGVALVMHSTSGAQLDRELKQGWSKDAVASSAQGCVQVIIVPTRRDYIAAAERAGNANVKPFPEAELRGSVEPMCGCISRRLATTYTWDQAYNSPQLAQPFVEDALAGGECAPEGLLGELLKKKRQAGTP